MNNSVVLNDGKITTRKGDYGYDLVLDVGNHEGEYVEVRMDLREILALNKLLSQAIDKEVSKIFE